MARDTFALMPLDLPTRYPEYVVTTVIIVLAPGPSVLFTIARAIAWGRATAVATVAGNVLGAFVISLVVAFGLGPILQDHPLIFLAVQILGGLYLIYLGITTLRQSQVQALEIINQGELFLFHGVPQSLTEEVFTELGLDIRRVATAHHFDGGFPGTESRQTGRLLKGLGDFVFFFADVIRGDLPFDAAAATTDIFQ